MHTRLHALVFSALVLALTAPVATQTPARYDVVIRNEADYTIGVVGAVQEVIRIAEEGHLPGIVAHMKALGPASWGLSMALVERINGVIEKDSDAFTGQLGGRVVTPDRR